jgi:hypothetical protein
VKVRGLRLIKFLFIFLVFLLFCIATQTFILMLCIPLSCNILTHMIVLAFLVCMAPLCSTPGSAPAVAHSNHLSRHAKCPHQHPLTHPINTYHYVSIQAIHISKPCHYQHILLHYQHHIHTSLDS